MKVTRGAVDVNNDEFGKVGSEIAKSFANNQDKIEELGMEVDQITDKLE